MESRWDYPSEHLRGLYKMREQAQLCDVIIHVGGRKYRAHKAVLAATGNYFLTMFTSGFNFKENSSQEITIEGSAAAFEILLNFVYTGKVDRRKVATCMFDVLEMACYMQFKEFAETCSSAIQKVLLKTRSEDLSVIDVCKIMLLAQTSHKYLSSLYKATLMFLEDKVENLKSLDLFLRNISPTFLHHFLGRDLSTASEEQHVLELVINWLKHDWEGRKGHSHQLLQKVRLGLVASEVIKKLIGPEILEIPGCSELVQRVLDLQASQKPMEALAFENPDIAASRTRSNVTAPVRTASLGKLQFYRMERKKWVGMKKMDSLPAKTKTDKYELIVVNGILYAAGGPTRKDFLMYQASENKWVHLPSKPLGKMRIKLVAHGVYIYAFGACCESGLRVIERYHINAKKWEVLKKVEESSSDNSTSKFTIVAVDTTTTPMSNCCQHGSSRAYLQMYHNFAVVFDGKIFVSSLERKRDVSAHYSSFGDHDEAEDLYYLEEKLTIFDPKSNTCEVSDLDTSRSEEEHGSWEQTCFKPTLFMYQDQLYRMISGLSDEDVPVFVSKLSFTQGEGGKMIVSLGKEELRPHFKLYDIFDNEYEPFYIQDNIFVKGRCDKVKYGENKQLVYVIYDMYAGDSDIVFPVWFSFEKKRTCGDDDSDDSDDDSDNCDDE